MSAPIMAWVVETGRPVNVAKITQANAPISTATKKECDRGAPEANRPVLKLLSIPLEYQNPTDAPIAVLSKTADALPGFGIVAAVLGIVITMGAIDGPVEEIGHKVGSALVGTFLGILLSYGLCGPLVTKLEFMGVAELAYFKAIATMVQGFADNQPPKIVLEVARRGLSSDVRPTQEELEALLKAVDSGG